MADKKKESITEDKFTKEQILNSKKYANNIDLLRTILEEDKTYSHDDLEKEINKYYKKKVI